MTLNILRMRSYVKDIIGKYDIDLISVHNPPSNWIASFSKVPVVWSCNEPISLCFSTKKPDYFPLNVDPPSFLAHSLERIYEVVDYVLCHWGIERIVVLSRYTQRGVQNIYDRESSICSVGADLGRFEKGGGKSVRGRRDCDDSFLLLQVGHFKPEKNQELSVRALYLLKDKIPNARLVFVGAGALEVEVRNLAESLGIQSRVTFAGRISDEQLPDYYDSCDLVLFPAVRQSWGLVIFEALAAGKVSLVSSDCGVSEVILDEDIGFVCDPNPESFAGKLLEIYNARRSLPEIAKRGREYVRRELSFNVYGDRMARLFQDVLDERTT